MLFSEQGFSPDLSNNEFKINDLIDEIRRGVVKNGKKTTKADFDIYDHFMSDRQCAKRIFLKRGNTLRVYPNYLESEIDWQKGDYVSDDDVNKMVYGFDLKRKQLSSYSMWKTDNESRNLFLSLLKEPLQIKNILSGDFKSKFSTEDPDIVSERIDGINKDESPDENLDSPFKPIRREDKIFEEIYTLKKEIRNDFYQLGKMVLNLEDDKNYIKSVLSEITKYVINNTYMTDDYRRSDREGIWMNSARKSSFRIDDVYDNNGQDSYDIFYEDAEKWPVPYFDISNISFTTTTPPIPYSSSLATTPAPWCIINSPYSKSTDFINKEKHLYAENINRLFLDFPVGIDHTEKLTHLINNLTFSSSGIYAVLHALKILCKENIKKSEDSLNYVNRTQYLDFVIKPDSTQMVYLKLNGYLKDIIEARNKFHELELSIDDRLKLIDKFKSDCESTDRSILDLKVDPFAKKWAKFRLHLNDFGLPTPNASDYEDGRKDYERERARLENVKQTYAKSLMKDLSGIFINNARTVKVPPTDFLFR